MKKNSASPLPKFISQSVKKTLPDERGNYFVVESDQLMLVRSISLKLINEAKSRYIGTLFVNSRVIKMNRNRSKHLFRKNNSYGFNEHLIRTAILFDFIELTDEKGTYMIPKNRIMEDGTYLDFKEIGFERQIFLRIEIIEQYKQ
jgi:hypothetical protein